MQACFRYLRKARRIQSTLPARRQGVTAYQRATTSSVFLSVRSASSTQSVLLRRFRRPVRPRSSLFVSQKWWFAVEQVDVPNLGDSISEGAVANILKNVGEGVVVDEVVMEIETDKVTIEIRSPKSGVVTEITTEVDAEVAVGDPLFKIDTDGKVDPSAASAPNAAAAPATPSTPPPPQSAPKAAAPAPPSAPSVTSSQPKSGQRIPMIQFKFGVRDPPASATGLGSADNVEFVYVGEEYGRLGFSDVDIAIINSGGAEYLDVMQILKKKKVAKKK